tara:strand:- start:544 stop:906 length:363 start_codon:yes stop_codon:yes gene_type:complete
MTKEQKEGLVKMDWREVIIKRKQIKDRSRQKPQTRMAGGSKPSQSNEQYLEHYSNKDETDLDEHADDEMDRLANMTREDLEDKVLEMIDGLSKEQLLELLESSLGDIKVHNIEYDDNRSA